MLDVSPRHFYAIAKSRKARDERPTGVIVVRYLHAECGAVATLKIESEQRKLSRQARVDKQFWKRCSTCSGCVAAKSIQGRPLYLRQPRVRAFLALSRDQDNWQACR